MTNIMAMYNYYKFNVYIILHVGVKQITIKADRVKRYLSNMWPAKVQVSLHIRADTQEPSLFTHTIQA